MGSSSSIKEPQAAVLPVLDSAYFASRIGQPTGTFLQSRAKALKRKMLTREGWIGDYDYTWLCTPALPFLSKPRPPPFYALDADLPLVLAISSGLQHALAMLAGLITPPIIFASALSLDPAISAYMISASLIGCGILSLVFDAMYKDGTCPSIVSSAGVVTRGPCPDAYGKVLGTSLICAFLEIFMSFFPPRVLKRLFPPIVTGTVILMIGASLIGASGVLNWGGGSNGCINGVVGAYNELCPTIYAPRPLPWGSPEFIGLGFLSFASIILTEMFGSPFLKNISVIVGLVVGCIVAGGAGYFDGSSIKSAPAITFLW
ncbi:hypothetical protein H0H87_007781 [Tephrocybe sp. NHM501043]|nr:hypothetical protein H0H87_007781 [Tephrocybe sp. NHM501043]